MTNTSHEENQYLSLVRNIICKNTRRDDRTGTGTLSLFGAHMRFCLRDNKFPLITTKKVFWRGVVQELLWMVKGSTNSNELSEKGVRIWEKNGSRQFLDDKGFTHREEGDLGPVYGFQWRHFGCEYNDHKTDYKNKGFDQLADCIHKIKHDPTSRRIVMTAWNPLQNDDMSLPACHMFNQFYVADGELSCHMYQRSADVGLGVPFNIASYSLLTCMVARVCGLVPGDFVYSIGDAHVYMDHVNALKKQIARTPYTFPTLDIVGDDVTTIDGFTEDCFQLNDYNYHPKIYMNMSS